ncbi:MAG: asparagine synthase (glutamine-hydrolyzing) [Phycisphaerae bacterium]
MCGIAGIIAPCRASIQAALGPMMDAQRQRGPDDFGSHIVALNSCALGLGFRRLSILDLSPAGHQPMVHPETGDVLVFNGEIYNFRALRTELEKLGERFVGNSDSEVLLHALTRWGVTCIERLEGMFAFAFYDNRRRELWLARDPVGIKPLYTARVPGVFLFASSARAIAASGMVRREADPVGVASFAAYGAVQEPATIFKDVRAFPAGCYKRMVVEETWRGERGIISRYWRFPSISERMPTEQEAVERVRDTLNVAVRDHLVSDVPIGVFLSSGIDSTTVAALAARHSPQIKTFTIGLGDHPDRSEAQLSSETARALGTDHTEIRITTDDALKSTVEWLSHLDQPSIDGLNTYIISKAVRSQGIIVALSGLGGDELFGGYSTFNAAPRFTNWVQRGRWMPARLRRGIASTLGFLKPHAIRSKMTDLAGSNGDLLSVYLQLRRVLADDQLSAMNAVDPIGNGQFLPPSALDGVEWDIDDAVVGISRLETRLYMGNTLLRDADANGMAHSLEIRVPFLDTRMLNLVHAMPGRVRLPTGVANKHLLRVAFASEFRAALTSQPKRGFTLPIGEWMRGPLRDLCRGGLESLASLGMFNTRAVDHLWEFFDQRPDAQRWSRAFVLAVTGLYARTMEV